MRLSDPTLNDEQEDRDNERDHHLVGDFAHHPGRVNPLEELRQKQISGKDQEDKDADPLPSDPPLLLLETLDCTHGYIAARVHPPSFRAVVYLKTLFPARHPLPHQVRQGERRWTSSPMRMVPTVNVEP